jgi:uncharacterized protein (DUF2345 family)
MAVTAGDAQLYSNLTTAPASSFKLKGGLYGIAIQGTMGVGGQPVIQILGPDGSNYITTATFTQAAYTTINLIAGTYRLSIGTATAIYAEIVRIQT